MSVWYVDSVSYAATTAWATNVAKTAGALVRATAPAVGSERIFVCIIAGTTHTATEPTWVNTKGAKTTDGAVSQITWQECTGQPGINGNLTDCPLSSSVRSTTPALGAIIQNNAGTYLFIMSTSGACGAGEPSYTLTAGVTTADSSGTWTCLGAVGNFTAFLAPHARLSNAFASTWGAAGDTFYVGDDHAATQAANLTLASPGTTSLPCAILDVDHTVAVPGTSNLKTTAKEITTSTFTLTITGAAYFNGMIFQCGTGASGAIFTMGSATVTQIYENCAVQKLGTTSANAAITINQNCDVVWKNTTAQVGNTGDRIIIGKLRWEDTASAITGATIPLGLFRPLSTSGSVIAQNVDFSALVASPLVATSGQTGSLLALFDKCKLGTGYVVAGTLPAGSVVCATNCDSGATNYQMFQYALEGALTTSATVARTGGNTDGVTPTSWKIVTTSSASWIMRFYCTPAYIWNSTLSTNRVVTMYGISNSAALLNNAQIWIKINYLGSSSTPIGSTANSGKANYLTTPTTLTVDTSAWDSAATARANTTAYAVGDVIKLASNSGRIFFCTTAGTTSGSEPGGYASAVDGGSVTDNTAVFRAGCRFLMTVTLSSPQPAMVGDICAAVRVGVASQTLHIDPQIVLS